MPRIALGLSYNGARFSGWQYQNERLPTVQKSLESALSVVADEKVSVVCAGRTDKGVHAAFQVVHFDTQAERIMRAWIMGTNTHLPESISVHWAQTTQDDFHARFTAVRRRYQYFIYSAPVRSALYAEHTTWSYETLEETRMHEAAQCLVGEHDFSSFRAADCQSNTPFRHIDFVRVSRQGPFICIDIQGNAFLHHMVRNIVGVLLPIGASKQDISWCEEVLEAKDRSAAGVTADPNGLYLVDIEYPEAMNIPSAPGAPLGLGQLFPL